MKKMNDVKTHIISYFKNLSRERIAIFICIPLSLVALSISAVMLVRLNRFTPQIPNETVIATEAPTQSSSYPPDSPYGLCFEKLNNGKCAISGIGDFNDKELKIPRKSPNGELVVEIKANAFENCEMLESVTIPDTVEVIGKNAFSGCSSLIYIDVDIDNEAFTSLSGVLFSKSRTRLIYYPAGKTDEKYYLNPNVKAIDANAFEDAKRLTAILYPKSTADFEAITIGEGNEIIKALPITCNYTGSNSGK